ncbi:hypothetical protein [Sporolactobacillus terrae]|uniref:hypothetical protein n=1 Tax=Sporolactobacillus terrae TaxID=269673 RepID=UPI00111B1C05|nr:hypothetical protein [Sporolactobacillus terrae]
MIGLNKNTILNKIYFEVQKRKAACSGAMNGGTELAVFIFGSSDGQDLHRFFFAGRKLPVFSQVKKECDFWSRKRPCIKRAAARITHGKRVSRSDDSGPKRHELNPHGWRLTTGRFVRGFS